MNSHPGTLTTEGRPEAYSQPLGGNNPSGQRVDGSRLETQNKNTI